jgi:hypothetical protein
MVTRDTPVPANRGWLRLDYQSRRPWQHVVEWRFDRFADPAVVETLEGADTVQFHASNVDKSGIAQAGRSPTF